MKCTDVLLTNPSQVCINYKDNDVLREECEEGRRLGFNGKVTCFPLLVKDWSILSDI